MSTVTIAMIDSVPEKPTTVPPKHHRESSITRNRKPPPIAQPLQESRGESMMGQPAMPPTCFTPSDVSYINNSHRPSIQKLRAYHHDQPYQGRKSPLSAVSSTLHTPLPSPPTSPLPKRPTRFKIHRTGPLALSQPLQKLKGLHGRFSSAVGSRLEQGLEHRAFSNLRARLRLVRAPTMWIFMYFALNLSLTLHNKFVLIHFPFPYTLTALHALCGTVGTFAMFHLGLTSDPPLPELTLREAVVVGLFSGLYTINIVVSNASLKLVTVPFHQVVRGSAPLFTIALSALLLRKGCSRAKLISLLPVIFGVALATYGDYYCTVFGFLITIFGTVLAALKTILTNEFLRPPSGISLLSLKSQPSHAVDVKNSDDDMTDIPSSAEVFIRQQKDIPGAPGSPYNTGSAVHLGASTSRSRIKFDTSLPRLSLTPLQLLYLMSPLAFIHTTVLAHLTGELDRVNIHLATQAALNASKQLPGGWGLGGLLGFAMGGLSGWLMLNGLLAFALNVVSFNSNKEIGPLGMTVAANVKQVLTVLCAVGLFNLRISMTNGLGIALTLAGGAWYATVEMQEKHRAKRML